MSQWVGVHGIGKEYQGRNQILDRWIPALTDGLEWATKRRRQVDLDLAYYGHLFRRADAGRPGKGSRADTDAAFLADVDEEELADLRAAVAEIVPPADLAAAEAAAAVAASKERLWVPVGVASLIGAAERRFPPTSGVLFLGTLRQVRRYLRDPSVKAEVDQITGDAAAGASVLIAHSLGSVVAYEFLRQHPGHSVKLLLTLGSPLGLRMVRDQLPPGDPGVARWVNIRSPRDPVTAAGNLRRWYPGAVGRTADNGFDAHSAERYLCCKATGLALKDYLPAAGQ